MFGGYLFFFLAAFFFAGMISPPVWATIKLGLGGQILRLANPIPQYIVVDAPIVKRNLHPPFPILQLAESVR